jgi:hypothetical protein
MESHEECLARGLEFANEQFLGIDFTQYAEVRNQTMDWTTENCARLFHTPRVSEESAHKMAVTYWAKATYNTRQRVVKALKRVKKRVSLIRTWLIGGKQSHAVIKLEANSSSLDYTSRRLNMPFGFEAVCDLHHPCRLLYRNESISAPTMTDLAEAVTDAKRTAATFHDLDEIISVFTNINSCFIVFFFLLEFTAIMTYLAMSLHVKEASPQSSASKTSPRLKSFSKLEEDERYASGSLIIQLAVSLAQWKLYDFTNSGSRYLLPFGLLAISFSGVQLMNFHLLDTQVEHIRNVFRAISELVLIMGDRECDIPLLLLPGPETTADLNDRPDHRNKAAASDKPEVTSKVAARFISPTTTMHEDIQAELKTIRGQQDESWRSRFEADSDSDTDTDDDDDDDKVFVELGCSALPTVSEKNGGWTFVDS